jgi:hypothetical protein
LGAIKVASQVKVRQSFQNNSLNHDIFVLVANNAAGVEGRLGNLGEQTASDLDLKAKEFRSLKPFIGAFVGRQIITQVEVTDIAEPCVLLVQTRSSHRHHSQQ